MGIEALIVDLIEKRRRLFFLQIFFCVLSFFYQQIVAVRHFFYDTGLFKSYSVSLPVVSVGNIVAGGTGKTPFVQKIAMELSQGPGSVGILSRGYRSQAENKFVMASLGKGPLVSSAVCGDESYWLATATDASIWVGKDRLWSANHAHLSRSKVLLLEDGFQHRKMKRDVEIVLLDAKDLFGHGYFLPRGYLRDFPSRLKKADFVVLTHLEEGFSERDLMDQVSAFTKAPLLGVASVYFLDPKVKGKKVGAFCGIAKPAAFYKALSLQGVEIVKILSFADHRAPSLEDLSSFALECQALGADFLICTEKDQVKLLDSLSLPLPIEVLKMELECVWNQNIWKEMIQSIKNRM